MKPIPTNKKTGDTERLLCPRTPQGPAWFQDASPASGKEAVIAPKWNYWARKLVRYLIPVQKKRKISLVGKEESPV